MCVYIFYLTTSLAFQVWICTWDRRFHHSMLPNLIQVDLLCRCLDFLFLAFLVIIAGLYRENYHFSFLEDVLVCEFRCVKAPCWLSGGTVAVADSLITELDENVVNGAGRGSRVNSDGFPSNLRLITPNPLFSMSNISVLPVSKFLRHENWCKNFLSSCKNSFC